MDELADTVYANGEFLPQTYISGAYCIIVVTSQRQDFKSREYVEKYQDARAKYLGDPTKGKFIDSKRVALLASSI